jgi:hypothetical protein
MSSAGNFIIVTGGDALYFPLIVELIGSSLRFAGKGNEPINAESGVVLATEGAER